MSQPFKWGAGARDGEPSGPARPRRDSGIMRAPVLLKAENGCPVVSEFIRASALAIRQVAPARTIYGFIQPFKARRPHAFLFRDEQGHLVDVNESLSELLDAESTPCETVFVENAEHARSALRLVRSGVSCPHRAERVWILLRSRCRTFGAFCLERDGCGFSRCECDDLRRLAELVTSSALVQADLLDAQCELAVLRALGAEYDTYLLFRSDRKEVVWASERSKPVNWARDVEPIESALIESAESLLLAKSRDDILPSPPSSLFGIVAAVSPVTAGSPVSAGCTAVGFLPPEDQSSAIMQLSEQERRVARLLIRGYQPINIAALTGISEHTVRTYIRRAYKKLQVSNRADLVRRLLTPNTV